MPLAKVTINYRNRVLLWNFQLCFWSQMAFGFMCVLLFIQGSLIWSNFVNVLNNISISIIALWKVIFSHSKVILEGSYLILGSNRVVAGWFRRCQLSTHFRSRIDSWVHSFYNSFWRFFLVFLLLNCSRWGQVSLLLTGKLAFADKRTAAGVTFKWIDSLKKELTIHNSLEKRLIKSILQLSTPESVPL